jgi:ferritin-like metal-binding protein YciE
MAKEKTLEDLFHDTLKDIYYAERKILKALPKMAKHAESEALKEALKHHLEETKGQVERIEKVFDLMQKPARGEACEAIRGLIEEGDEVMEKAKTGTVGDAGLIAAGQAVEHYEIARYGTLVAWAKQLGMTEAADLLAQTLMQEKKADQKLNEIASKEVNRKAAEGAVRGPQPAAAALGPAGIRLEPKREPSVDCHRNRTEQPNMTMQGDPMRRDPNRREGMGAIVAVVAVAALIIVGLLYIMQSPSETPSTASSESPATSAPSTPKPTPAPTPTPAPAPNK